MLMYAFIEGKDEHERTYASQDWRIHQVAQVSIATLCRYYQCGLLKPNALDPDIGYHYYFLEQIACLN